jgi:hypothetical protein
MSKNWDDSRETARTDPALLANAAALFCLNRLRVDATAARKAYASRLEELRVYVPNPAYVDVLLGVSLGVLHRAGCFGGATL